MLRVLQDKTDGLSHCSQIWFSTLDDSIEPIVCLIQLNKMSVKTEIFFFLICVIYNRYYMNSYL